MIVHRFIDYFNGKETTLALEEFRTWLTSLHDIAGYSRAVITRPNGEIVVSVPDDHHLMTNHCLNMTTEAARRQEVIFSDFHRDDPSGHIHLNLIIPIKHTVGKHSKTIAVLSLEMDPHTFLYPLIRSWPTQSKTAETLLVERDGNDVLFLNDLRFRENTALSLRRPLTDKDMPAVRAVLNPGTIFEGIDYRGARVLTATRAIPGSPWVILAKVDTDEINAPVYKRAWFVAAVCLLTIIAGGLGVYLWEMRRKEGILRGQYEAEVRYSNDLRQAELSLQKARSDLELRVVERTAELTSSNVRLKREIVEREQLEKQLVEAKRLQAVGQLAGGVAHEVRNPLNAILSITEALFREKELESNPDFEPYIQHIRAQVNRLAHLMNDLLDLGKPIPTSSLHPVDLPELCRETIELWSATSTSRNEQQVLIVTDQHFTHPLVMADRMKLQQVLFNCLDNAAQHSPARSELLLTLVNEAGNPSSMEMASVRIIDTGRGIPLDKIPRVFEPFYTDRKGGTGLGLALVRHFIENMGGSVAIRNNDPPPGCTVEIQIPTAGEGLK